MGLTTSFDNPQKIFLSYITRCVSCGYAQIACFKSAFPITCFSNLKDLTSMRRKQTPVEEKGNDDEDEFTTAESAGSRRSLMSGCECKPTRSASAIARSLKEGRSNQITDVERWFTETRPPISRRLMFQRPEKHHNFQFGESK